MAFFGSRLFLEKLLAVSSSLSRANFQRHLETLISDYGWRLFSASYNPNRIRLKQSLRSSSDSRTALKLWNRFRRKHNRTLISAKERRGRCFTRRHVASKIGRQFGNFTGKNLYQILRKVAYLKMNHTLLSSIPNFILKPKRYTLKPKT